MTNKKSNKLPISIAIISFNEESNIERTLNSVNWASEIIVVDSQSIDKTVEIATSKGAKVFSENWKGYVEQKNFALKKCTQPWILSIDCDEVVTAELEQSIRKVINQENSNISGYRLKRMNYYLNKFLKYSWQPDLKLRFVKKEKNPHWLGYKNYETIHECLHVDGKVGKLQGELLHYSYKNISDHFSRTIVYSKIAANSYHKQGKKFKLYKLILNPIIAFFKQLIFKRAFLDGIHGWIVAFSSAFNVFLKYIMLWEIELKEKKKNLFN